MDQDHLLGSILRVEIGRDAWEGMLIQRRAATTNRPAILTMSIDNDHGRENSLFSPRSTDVTKVVNTPPRGSMLVMYGVGTPAECVRHLAMSRIQSLEWLRDNQPDWRMRKGIQVVPAHPDEHRWTSPVPFGLIESRGSMDFMDMPEGITGIPMGDAHPGAFQFERRHHIHEGVDIYVPEGTPVHAVESGRVMAIIPFTGAIATPPTPFWNDTWAILIEGRSGTVVYGEIDGITHSIGDEVQAGAMLGQVRRVLVKEKKPARPMSMLHLELHAHGTTDAYDWPVGAQRPPSLRDPTEMLLSAVLGG